MRGVLESMGIQEIEEAEDGQDAISKVDVFQPELILIDRLLPVIDGLTFVKTYRSRGHKTPIIMVTAEAEKSRVIDAIHAGVDHYVLKPFTPEGLTKIVTATLAKRAA